MPTRDPKPWQTMEDPSDFIATLRSMQAQLDHAATIVHHLPTGQKHDYVGGALARVISEVSKGVDGLLRQLDSDQQLGQAHLSAAHASAAAASTAAANASASAASAAAQTQASFPQRGRLPTPPPPPVQQRRKVTADDIYGYDPNGELRCRVCYKGGVPCFATDDHIASAQHVHRAQTPSVYNYNWPWK